MTDDETRRLFAELTNLIDMLKDQADTLREICTSQQRQLDILGEQVAELEAKVFGDPAPAEKGAIH